MLNDNDLTKIASDLEPLIVETYKILSIAQKTALQCGFLAVVRGEGFEPP